MEASVQVWAALFPLLGAGTIDPRWPRLLVSKHTDQSEKALLLENNQEKLRAVFQVQGRSKVVNRGWRKREHKAGWANLSTSFCLNLLIWIT